MSASTRAATAALLITPLMLAGCAEQQDARTPDPESNLRVPDEEAGYGGGEAAGEGEGRDLSASDQMGSVDTEGEGSTSAGGGTSAGQPG